MTAADTDVNCTAEKLEVVQKEVYEMLKGRILVGHAISNDEKVTCHVRVSASRLPRHECSRLAYHLQALFMNHPKRFIRDTQKYQGYRDLVGGRKPGLKMLCQKVLGIKIQSGEHSSVSGVC